MVPRHEPTTPRTCDPNGQHQDRPNLSSDEEEYELASDTAPYETVPSDPPPSYYSHKDSTSQLNLDTPIPPPFSGADTTITRPADAARPASPPLSPPPYPPPMRSPLRPAPVRANNTNNNWSIRKWPWTGDIVCATVLLLVAVFFGLAGLFACTVAVLSIARPRRVTYENAGAFFALAGYAVVVEVGVLCFAGGVYWCCWKRRRCF